MSGFVNRADGLIAPTSIDISLNCICFISDVLKTIIAFFDIEPVC